MAVYVDNAGVPHRGRRWYHLSADTLEELHAFAQAMGLKRTWYHSGARFPHYDITREQREAAIAAGARDVDSRELVAAAKRLLAALGLSPSRRIRRRAP